MAKLKFAVDSVDYGQAGDFEQPKPGVYVAEIQEINAGYAKGDDNKPDRSRPRLEVIFGNLKKLDDPDDDTVYARLWRYLSYSDAAEIYMAQFLEALGVATEKKRKGTWDPDEHIGKKVKIRVAADTDLNNEYRGKVAGVFAFDEDEEDFDDEEEEDVDVDEEEEEEEDVDEDDEEDEEDEDEDEDEDEEEEEEDEEEEDESYEDWTVAELKEECEARDLKTSGSKKALAKRLEQWDEENPDDDEEDDDDDDDEAPF